MVHKVIHSENTLMKDVGERRIIDEIIIPKFRESKMTSLVSIGDDCVVLPWENNNLVWTMDPVPLPVVWLLGEKSFFTIGWYLVAINLSDIASMGAIPVGLMTNLEIPPDTRVEDFNDLLNGIKECSKLFNVEVFGGNIKDADKMTCTGSAIGYLNNSKPFTRNEVAIGQAVFCIGDVGRFWAAVFSKIYNIENSDEVSKDYHNALHRPIPRINESLMLANGKFNISCMDASDGLITSLLDFSRINNVSIEVTINESDIDTNHRRVFEESGAKILTSALAWGDWQLLCSATEQEYKEIAALMSEHDIPVTRIGTIKEEFSEGKVYSLINGKESLANPKLINQRFSENSYFTNGIGKTIEFLKNEEVFV